MGGIFTIKGIKPQRLKVDRIRLELLNEMRKEGTDHRKILSETTQTWQGETPKFESLIGLGRPPGGATVFTGPTGSEKAVDKWRWLDKGTSVRYAVMSSDWRSKTKPNRFRSGVGRGRMLFVNKKIRMPGIKARNWSEMGTKQRKRPFTRRMIRAMQRASAKAF